MIRVGHVLAEMAAMDAESVSCCVTSPPYWSLRRYDAPDAVWGDQLWCPHPYGFEDAARPATKMGRDGDTETIKNPRVAEMYGGSSRWQHTDVSRETDPEAWTQQQISGGTCPTCGAWKGQFGLEPTPELYL